MILYETKFLTLKAAKRSGQSDWVYVMRPNAENVVVILPVIKKINKTQILFLKTKRPPLINENVAKYCIELPAGLVADENPHETIQDALKKELLEETGLMACRFEILNKKAASSCGLTSETFVIACAYIEDDSIKSQPVSDNGVIVQRIPVEIKNINNFLKQQEELGCAISAQALAALFYLDFVSGCK